MANLGYIGLGAMGGRMAARLLSKGQIVTGYNRTRSKVQWLLDRGMIAVNLSLAMQMLAFSEGVLLAEKSGIARSTAVDALTHSVVASPMVQYRGPFVLGMPDEVWFSVTMMQKDMSLALEMGRELSVPLPTTAVTNEFLTAARGAGLSGQDFAALFSLLARLSGVTA